MHRQLAAALALVFLLVQPASAEMQWFGGATRYELTGAKLLRLRDELPPQLADALRAIRNQTFENEDSFLAALDPLLESSASPDMWRDRLVAEAVGGDSAFGVEPRGERMLTIVATGADRSLDDNPFTAASWLANLPPPSHESAILAATDGGCLVVSFDDAELFRLCQPTIGGARKSIQLMTEAASVAGLGQEFQVPGDTRVDRLGTVRTGVNQMTGFNGGANGNTLFPIAYFDHPVRDFALILDNRYGQTWDFSGNAFSISVAGGDLRFHVIFDDSWAAIRRRFMAMTGTPPVPPKAAFGLWISEYGFDDWNEVDDKLASLRALGFPVSGVVMDLQWFGGIAPNSPASRMGTLTWDETHFPDPVGKIAALAADGISMMAIEESYVSRDLPEFALLADNDALAHDAEGAPLLVNPVGNWWGLGGMIDHIDADARAYWHDLRRRALIDMGLFGHWTDLGEPEMFNPGFLYADGLTQPMVQNSYNLLWLQGIAEGYARTAPDRRPFMMSRSGGLGMQALGAVLWSGDTGSDFLSLASQFPQQAHLMWSGLDYYGSDVGGFHRGALSHYTGDRTAAMDELYTQWLAYSALFEVPVRPHTENLCNCKETAPDRIGDVAANLANLHLRYQLLPYYYALAHRAWRTGEPVFPSADYEFPTDPLARGIGTTRMIGPSLIGAAVAGQGADSAAIYLPLGAWYDFRTGERLDSGGETFVLPTAGPAGFQLPLLARDGGIVPVAADDGSLTLRVFGSAPSAFSVYDDDGISLAYQRGVYDRVDVSVDDREVELRRVVGGAIDFRRLEWVLPDASEVKRVLVDGVETAFAQNGAKVALDLPDLGDRLTIVLE